MLEVKKTAGDSAMFVTLMRVAREDAGVRKVLTEIVDQPPLRRKALLDAVIPGMRAKGAPEEFIEAIGFLLDDAVAAKAREMINGVAP